MEWKRFTIVPLDDYEVVMGQGFMQTEKEIPILHVDCLAIMSGPIPCLVPTMKGNKGMEMSSLRLVYNHLPCLDINGRGEEVVETNK
jgi:hypothetical protein